MTPIFGHAKERDPRLPPGQYDTGSSFPVLTAEVSPRLDAKDWTFRIDGLVRAGHVARRPSADDRRVTLATLTESGLDPSCLTLEITESVLMGEGLATVDTLRAIKELGVRLAIDDFGTGYSSLSYLQRFPIDVLMIDRAFVNAIDGAEGTALVRSIVDIGRSLHLETVAEGVDEVLALLRSGAVTDPFDDTFRN